jgi:putative redox protein
MKIQLTRLDDAFHMQASNEAGNTVLTDGSEKIGGSGKGMRPMEMLIASLGSCSAIDVIQFLKKFKQPLEHIELEIDAERDPDNVPSLFTKVNIHYRLKGDLDPKRTEKAISLSVDKYCSVSRILEKTAKISWSYEIVS